MASVYERLERPLIPVLADMESRGIIVEQSILARMSNDFASRMAHYQSEIMPLLARNLTSPHPNSWVKFYSIKWVFPAARKPRQAPIQHRQMCSRICLPTGLRLRQKSLEWRHIAKLKSTYADALVESILPETGRVHTSFSMVGASTGVYRHLIRMCRIFRSEPLRGGRSALPLWPRPGILIFG